jgi:hypothetical protein
MILDIQFKLKSNPLYIKYIHENSYWYKILNRDPSMWGNFVESVKDTYHLRTTDKINNALDAIDMITKVISTLK